MAALPAGSLERKLRADAYVLGRMNALERDRAQADLETDAQFRAEVLHAAQRLGFGGMEGRQTRADAAWNEIALHLATLPHMSGTAYPPRDAERSPTQPLGDAPTPRLARPILTRLGDACRDTWRTALALFRIRR